MPEPWSRIEVELIVEDYFAMLELELRGESFSKAAHRQELIRQLNRRSDGAIEFKHCNISAILCEAGVPFIGGYKPRSNWQSMLADVSLARLVGATGLLAVIAADTTLAPDTLQIEDANLLDAFVSAPEFESRSRVRDDGERPYAVRQPRLGVNFLEREAGFRALGFAGEEFVLRLEQARLVSLGCERLAANIQHVSRTRGDGLGYDILSYETDSRERLIEVKTTKYPKETPFFVSRNEVEVSKLEEDRYQLYRVFAFRKRPRVFTLLGALTASCDLEPESYRARPGRVT